MLFKRALAMYGKHFSFTVAKHRYKRVFFSLSLALTVPSQSNKPSETIGLFSGFFFFSCNSLSGLFEVRGLEKKKKRKAKLAAVLLTMLRKKNFRAEK